MNNSTKTYSLNFNNLKLIDGDYTKSDDWFEMICENGCFSTDSQYMTFSSDGIDVVVDFDLSVIGSVSHDPGDYWTPPYTDVDISEVEVNVTSLHIDEWEVELTKELKNFLEVEIKKYL